MRTLSEQNVPLCLERDRWSLITDENRSSTAESKGTCFREVVLLEFGCAASAEAPRLAQLGLAHSAGDARQPA